MIQEQLTRLLQYGPALNSHTPAGKPRWSHRVLGTISPGSKATDIAHNCGLQQVERLERGVAYYIEASDVDGGTVATSGRRAARPYDGDGVLFFNRDAGKKLLIHHQPAAGFPVSICWRSRQGVN